MLLCKKTMGTLLSLMVSINHLHNRWEISHLEFTERHEKGLDHFNWIMLTCVAPDFIDRLFVTQRLAVGTVRGHGVVHVGHGDDIGLREDVAVGEPVGDSRSRLGARGAAR